jgi:hypothetical protein
MSSPVRNSEEVPERLVKGVASPKSRGAWLLMSTRGW